MAPLAKRLRLKPLALWLGAVGLVTTLLAPLVLLSQATENSANFGRLYSGLLWLNTAGILSLGALIATGLFHLVRRLRRQIPGAWLSLRLTALFVALALAPVSVVYYFSLQFLQRGIDSWFDIQVETGLEDALALSRAALDLRMGDVLKQTRRLAERLDDTGPSSAPLALANALDELKAEELTLFDRSGAIVATVSPAIDADVPQPPPEGAMAQVIRGHDFVDVIPDPEGYYAVVVLVPTVDPMGPRGAGVLLGRFPLPERFTRLGESVQDAAEGYRQLLFLRIPLKASFILALSFVLLASALAAIAAAIVAANRVVSPLRQLAEGTRAVAAGHFDRLLPLAGRDELAFLVQSFNEMTKSLAKARSQGEASQRLVEGQRAYLGAVLGQLSSGVMTVDEQNRLKTINSAALEILGLELQGAPGFDPSAPLDMDLARWIDRYPHLEAFWDTVAAVDPSTGGELRRELVLFTQKGRRVLLCRGHGLLDPGGGVGRLVVFDDITQLVQAQRAIAWGEVARRLAHEIKNPLTPIQLQAERLRDKLKDALPEEHRHRLARSTHTIIQQVAALKEMVAAFDQYARPVPLKLRSLDLNALICEVLDLYRDGPSSIQFDADLDGHLPPLVADAGRLRQLLHNLLKNAQEAVLGATPRVEGHGGRIQLVTRGPLTGSRFLTLVVNDDGPGFPVGDIGDVFEPYVTTKPRGTGLGLAIVKKIVEDHGGDVQLGRSPLGGAQVQVRFPIPEDPPPSVPLESRPPLSAGAM
ncbi:MAG: ATP-binding protein [Candidatus Competibacterales bacterium]